MRRFVARLTVVLLCVLLALPVLASAATRLVLKSARQTSTYYAFAVGQANAIQAGAPEIEVTVEDSPGSMVNVKESKQRENFLFTSPPNLIASAIAGTGKFEEGGYEKIRALWPIPGLVMHWVVREDSGVETLADLAGKKFIPGGAGSAGARFTEQVFEAAGIKEQVEFQTVDLNEGVQAVKNRRAVGFATSSSAPAAMVSEIAATTPIRILSLDDESYQKVAKTFARYTIPASIYKGVDYDVQTISLLVGTYTSADVPDDVIYQVTKAFWENREVWEQSHPAMALVKMEGVSALKAKIHPGALKYYIEIGLEIPEELQ